MAKGGRNRKRESNKGAQAEKGLRKGTDRGVREKEIGRQKEGKNKEQRGTARESRKWEKVYKVLRGWERVEIE